MKFNTTSFLGIASLIARLLLVSRAFAQPEAVPPDVFEARPDGYVYADYPGVFDDAGGDGITIEAWIYLTARPNDGIYWGPQDREGQWVIFAKPGSYHVVMRGRDQSRKFDMEDPEGTAWIEFSVGGTYARRLLPEEYPLNRWTHVAYQIVSRKHEILDQAFIDRKPSGIGRGSGPLGRTPAPFVIGGTPVVTFKAGHPWGVEHRFVVHPWGDEHSSMEGYIDEVRVSEGWRYAAAFPNKIRPRRHFPADAQTIALWRFEEGAGAASYRDASGNGYRLFPGGTLAVHPQDKAAVTWGNLKRGAF